MTEAFMLSLLMAKCNKGLKFTNLPLLTPQFTRTFAKIFLEGSREVIGISVTEFISHKTYGDTFL